LLNNVAQVLTAGPISGINRKVQMKPLVFDDVTGDAIQLLFIIKWGGEITPAGLKMAEEAGVTFRHTMYPSAEHEDDGAGLLRLHSTFRHDLKIYSSDEGRVQVTAAAFAKGLLQLENDIPPILASLVRKDDFVNKLLDDVSSAAPLVGLGFCELNECLLTIMKTAAHGEAQAARSDAAGQLDRGVAGGDFAHPFPVLRRGDAPNRQPAQVARGNARAHHQHHKRVSCRCARRCWSRFFCVFYNKKMCIGNL
jgi:hypothetical protein